MAGWALGFGRRARSILAAAVLTTALAHMPVCAQPAQDAAGPTPAAADAQPATLRDDIKAFARAPLQWRGRQWLEFGGVIAGVTLAYQYDNRVRAHYANDGEPDYHEVLDSMPAAALFGGTWFAAKLGGSEEAQWEVGVMRRAIVLETLASEVVKVALRRERPGPDAQRNNWGDGDLSFPSGHTAAAFAIGTVFAESGDDKQRWWRRVVGYGVGAGTAFQRIHHDAHWLSDTVAGAALGIATAKWVMKRREDTAPRGDLAVLPLDGGVMLTYTVPIR
jgi:PAP2 superfamily